MVWVPKFRPESILQTALENGDIDIMSSPGVVLGPEAESSGNTRGRGPEEAGPTGGGGIRDGAIRGGAPGRHNREPCLLSHKSSARPGSSRII